MPLRVLIVHNEQQERASLVELCQQRDDVQIVGEAESGVAALRAADKVCPDVMFVDVELPDMSGFDLLNAAHRQSEPASIIVTGGPNDAAAALAAGAVDYLLKPVDAARLGQSLERAQRRRQSLHENVSNYLGLEAPPGDLQAPSWSHDKPRFLVGERQHRFYPLEVENIDYIEARGNYVVIHRGSCEYVRRDSMKRLAAYLADRGFIRIERSILLNVRAVIYAQVAAHGTFTFTLSSGACIQSSTTYRATILDVIPLATLSKRRVRSSLTHDGKSNL